MKMELLESGCLKIVLTDDDMWSMGLTFETLDYRKEETRCAISQLLITAKETIGFETSSGLTVEAVPVEGGCLLLLTPTAVRRRVRMKQAVGPYIYQVPNVNGLFQLAENWERLCMQPDTSSDFIGSSLYRVGESYALVLYPAAALSSKMEALLGEFALSVGEGDAMAAFAAEHGKPLAVGDALPRLWQAIKSARENTSILPHS